MRSIGGDVDGENRGSIVELHGRREILGQMMGRETNTHSAW